MSVNICDGNLFVVDFDTDGVGASIGPGEFIDGESLYSNFGLTISTIGVGTVSSGPNAGDPRRAMTFPSESPTYAGPDTDLINVGSGLGNILIVSANNQGPGQGDPENTMEDSNSGGTISFTWDHPVEILALTVIDADISALNRFEAYADTAGAVPAGLNIVIQAADGSIQVFDILNTPFIQRLDFTFLPGEGIGIDDIIWRNCACPFGQAFDCAGNCNSIGTPPIYTTDCAGVCYPIGSDPPNSCDCSGNCFPTNTDPPSVPDCNGVCDGPGVLDCLGECDGSAVIDCDGNCDGNAFVDCNGDCIDCVQPPTKFKNFKSKHVLNKKWKKISKIKSNQKVFKFK